jgi:outer membrane protein OmpA-like peptidoglycan-associated protein
MEVHAVPASRFARLAFAGVIAAASLLVVAPPARATDAADGVVSCVGKARLRGSLFQTGAHDLEVGAKVQLDLVAESILKNCAGKVVTIEGHTDLYGDAAYNKGLSLRRANEVKEYLVSKGVPADQLRTVGYGHERPIAREMTREAQQLNRRVSFVSEGTPERVAPPAQ